MNECATLPDYGDVIAEICRRGRNFNVMFTCVHMLVL
jgi:hypothetical protein